MAAIALSPTYFGPIAWYRQLVRNEGAWIDHDAPFRKRSFQNRCTIMTANGPQTLTVPIASHPHPTPLISNHGKWRQEHWNALRTAYSDSPFFLYYADDLKPFFEEQRWTSLYDFDEAIALKMCELLDIPAPLSQKPKETLPQPTETATEAFPPYYQVFQQRHGFQPNLSILDLLFNLGPEATLYLQP